jgi:hypothetical protein
MSLTQGRPAEVTRRRRRVLADARAVRGRRPRCRRGHRRNSGCGR